MITVLISVVIGVFIGLYNAFKPGSWADPLTNVIGGGTLGFFLGFIIALCIPNSPERHVETMQLETIQDNNSFSGSFFLGTGQIEGKMKYVFYYKTNGGFKMKQLDYDNVQINYSKGNPRIERIHFVTNSLFSLNMRKESYMAYVPEGTIRQNYSLDAK